MFFSTDDSIHISILPSFKKQLVFDNDAASTTKENNSSSETCCFTQMNSLTDVPSQLSGESLKFLSIDSIEPNNEHKDSVWNGIYERAETFLNSEELFTDTLSSKGREVYIPTPKVKLDTLKKKFTVDFDKDGLSPQAPSFLLRRSMSTAFTFAH